MAATGLGSFNPYGRTAPIDITSRPFGAMIQAKQKQLAKAEALDKYFQEYDKTINPAGMRNQDVDAVVKLKNEAKKFYFENKDAIQNTSKDNGKAYSQLMNMYTDASGIINKSKEQAATGKVVTQAYLDAKKNNKTIPLEVQEAIFSSQLPINSPGFRTFDPVNFDAYDKFDATKYAQNIYSKIKPSEEVPVQLKDKKTGAEYYKTEKKIGKDALGLIEADVVSLYNKDRGFKDAVEDIMKDQNQINKLAKEYKAFTGKDMPATEKDLAVAYTIALRPPTEVSYSTPSNWRVRADYADKLIKGRANLNSTQGSFDFLTNGISKLKSGDANTVNQYFSAWGAQGKPDITGEKIGFKNIEYLPGGKVKVNFTSPVSGKGGVTVGAPNFTIIDLNSPNLLTDLSALHQSFLGSDAKLEKKIMSTPMSNPNLKVGDGFIGVPTGGF
jgi:hypothetical protein